MNLCESVKSVGVFYVPRISQIYTDFLCPGLAASAFTFPQSAVWSIFAYSVVCTSEAALGDNYY